MGEVGEYRRMKKQLTLVELGELLENDESIEYVGQVKNKVFYRQRSFPSNIPSRLRPNKFRLVYVVVP